MRTGRKFLPSLAPASAVKRNGLAGEVMDQKPAACSPRLAGGGEGCFDDCAGSTARGPPLIILLASSRESLASFSLSRFTGLIVFSMSLPSSLLI